MLNYCSPFIPNYSTVSAPLRALTRKGQPFHWTADHESSFKQLKESLSKSIQLSYYNPEAETEVIIDASPTGLGAILAQKQDDGQFRPIRFGSRALTDVESRYSQTEREALAARWSCEHFHYFIYHRPFTIRTDHKPLEKLLSSKSNPPPRIQRWLLYLQAYDYQICYVRRDPIAADYLSRYHPFAINSMDQSPESADAEHHVNAIISDAVPKFFTLQNIVDETKSDPVLCKVIENVKRNNWLKSDNETRPYYNVRNELSVKQGLLLKQNCIVIPTKLKSVILQKIHPPHQGIVKTKALVREKVWWPTVNKDIETRVSCQVTDNRTAPPEPIHMTETPLKPWMLLATDLKGPVITGEHILVVIDYMSRYPVVEVLDTITSQDMIRSFRKIFAAYGYPETITVDNGKQFNSAEFRDFMHQHNIKLRPVTPYWPSANGEVERFNRTIGKVIQGAVIDGQNWKDALQDFIHVYRTTPHSTTKVPPAKVLFRYNVKNDLPDLDLSSPSTAKIYNQLKATDKSKKSKIKSTADQSRNSKEFHSYNPGDKVLVKNINRRNKSESFWLPDVFTIIKVYSASVKVAKGKRIFIRHKTHIKHYHRPPHHRPPVVSKPAHRDVYYHQPLSMIQLEPDPEVESDSESELSDHTLSLSDYSGSSDDSDESVVDSDATIPYNESDEQVRSKRQRKMPNKYADFII